MLTLDEVVILKEQLEEFQTALVSAEQHMKVTIRFGYQAKEMFPVCTDEMIIQEGNKQMKMTQMGGELAVR